MGKTYASDEGELIFQPLRLNGNSMESAQWVRNAGVAEIHPLSIVKASRGKQNKFSLLPPESSRQKNKGKWIVNGCPWVVYNKI